MIKQYLNIGIVLLIVSLGVSTYVLYNNTQELKQKLSISISNEKAFLERNSELQEESRAFQFTVQQLEFSKDSLLQKVNNLRKSLDIKDKDLKRMEYLLSEASKTDTIILRDTIFKDPTLNIDTLMGDKWYSLELGLKFPNTIIVKPSFEISTGIFTNLRKETIKPPKKFFLARWFQKKHKVLEVKVVEENPYVNKKEQLFIEILDNND